MPESDGYRTKRRESSVRLTHRHEAAHSCDNDRWNIPYHLVAMRWVLFLCFIPICSIWAADERHLDGERIELATGDTATSFVVGINGGDLMAEHAANLTGKITLEALSANGLTATVIANSLRGVLQDDWRTTQTIAGTRTDATIDFPSGTFGTHAEHTSWGIDGTDGDWGN